MSSAGGEQIDEQDRQNLFRQEALNFKRTKLEGDVIVLANGKLTAATVVLSLAVLIAAGFLARADIPRIQQTSGWLTTMKGLVTVQALKTGVVEEVRVRDGQMVRPGDILATVRVEQLQPDIGGTPERLLVKSIGEQDRQLLDQIALTQSQAVQDGDHLRVSVASLDREATAIDEQIHQQRTVVAIARKTSAASENLANMGALARREVWIEQSDLAQKSRDLAALQQTRADLASQLATATTNLNRVPIDRDAKIADLQGQRAALQQRLLEVQGQRSYAITAPVSGKVTSLVARPGYPADGRHPLMLIVPAGASLAAELFVPSSAIAFIKPGQSVRLLYDAFPYQRFGTQIGRVARVSSSAMLPTDVLSPTEMKEPVYLVSVDLSNTTIDAYGTKVPLEAGMTLQADVVLESRSVFEWVFEPLFAVRGRG